MERSQPLPVGKGMTIITALIAMYAGVVLIASIIDG